MNSCFFFFSLAAAFVSSRAVPKAAAFVVASPNAVPMATTSSLLDPSVVGTGATGTLVTTPAMESSITSRQRRPSWSRLFATAKKRGGGGGMSMAERRRRRAKRGAAAPRNPMPPRPQRKKSESKAEEKNISGKKSDATHAANPAEAAAKAQELLQAQRESVAMLTLVRERVEEKISESILERLERQGYCYIDDFLGDAAILKKLEEEGSTMLEKGEMQVDVSNLGSGEYIAPITGGKDQYNLCPRAIEFVVATTKHFPTPRSALSLLDTANCISEMRTFDRKAWLASAELLTGGKDVSSSTSAVESAADRPFRRVVEPEASSTDRRRVSLRYYLVPEGWHEAGAGGGLSFQREDEEGIVETVEAARDRLVLWKSDQTQYRSEAWIGGDDQPVHASCIQLHLVKK